MANDEAPRKGPKTPSRCNIVECHMLRQFSYLFACYWELLRKVLSLSNVCSSNSQHFFCLVIVEAYFLFENGLFYATIGNRAFSYDRCKLTELSYNMANNTFLKSVRIYFESYLHCWSRLYFCIWPHIHLKHKFNSVSFSNYYFSLFLLTYSVILYWLLMRIYQSVTQSNKQARKQTDKQVNKL